ncbi:hypothetical protein [Psychrobacter sp.]|uniref:hypothetical protein n=1 Tax=Psychrobacter sp. TaxID=56811 RepID=UPI0025DB088A|nr:hypothetical protein [Psychrobacter sp.]
MLTPDYIINRNLERRFEREQYQFDSAQDAKKAAEGIEFDLIDERQATHATTQMRLAALQIVLMMAGIVNEVDFADQDLLPSELLDSLILESFNEDPDDDDDEIDSTVKSILAAHISDALSSLGVDDDMISDIFDGDTEIADPAIEAASEIVLENMPADSDLDNFIATFAYGDDEMLETPEEEALEDEGMYDAARKPLSVGKTTKRKVGNSNVVYKAVKAVRNGKLTVVNKRIAGKVRLSPAQKSALKKARKKSTTGTAVKKRMLSFAKGLKRGIYNIDPVKAKNMSRGLKAGHYRRSTGV